MILHYALKGIIPCLFLFLLVLTTIWIQHAIKSLLKHYYCAYIVPLHYYTNKCMSEPDSGICSAWQRIHFFSTVHERVIEGFTLMGFITMNIKTRMTETTHSLRKLHHWKVDTTWPVTTEALKQLSWNPKRSWWPLTYLYAIGRFLTTAPLHSIPYQDNQLSKTAHLRNLIK